MEHSGVCVKCVLILAARINGCMKSDVEIVIYNLQFVKCKKITERKKTQKVTTNRVKRHVASDGTMRPKIQHLKVTICI